MCSAELPWNFACGGKSEDGIFGLNQVIANCSKSIFKALIWILDLYRSRIKNKRTMTFLVDVYLHSFCQLVEIIT